MIFLNENRALAMGVAVLDNCFRMGQKSSALGVAQEERQSIGKLQLNTRLVCACRGIGQSRLLEFPVERRPAYAKLTRGRGYIAVIVTNRFLDRVQFDFLEALH